MTGQVLTEVSAIVSADREADLVTGYQRIIAGPIPDGLVRTELLRGHEGSWRIQTLWRDQAALDAARSMPDPPAAPTLFREVGADPQLVVFGVVARLLQAGEDSR
jgi:hypothetical protein